MGTFDLATLKLEKPLKAVIYTDGGCRASKPGDVASRGTAAWGMHGYFFTEEPSKVGTGCKKGAPTKTGYREDAPTKPDITLHAYVDGFGAIPGIGTNNVAELTAVKRAIEEAIRFEVTSLLVLLDSQYVIKGLTEWSRGWIKRGWVNKDGQPVANAELWKALLAVLETFKAKGTFRCQWVKGHTGNLGNDLADFHATRGIVAQRNGMLLEKVTYTPAKGYWNHKSDRNRLFTHANWYFATQGKGDPLSFDGRHVYYAGDPREKDEFFGKPISDATFSVLYLKDQDPVLETIKQTATELGRGRYQGLMVAHLNRLLQAETYNDIAKNGDLFLVKDFGKQKIKSSDETLDEKQRVLVHEERPARLAFQALNCLESLEAVLHDCLVPPKTTKQRQTDITDLLYERTDAKKPTVKLKKSITSSLKALEVDVVYTLDGKQDQTTKLTLSLDIDLPHRNALVDCQ